MPQWAIVLIGVLVPFAGTVLGSGLVVFMKREIHPTVQKFLLGFAAGVMTAESDTGASERMRCSAPLHEMLTDWSSPCSLTRTEMRPEEKVTSCALISGAMAAASSLIASESSERP